MINLYFLTIREQQRRVILRWQFWSGLQGGATSVVVAVGGGVDVFSGVALERFSGVPVGWFSGAAGAQAVRVGRAKPSAA